MFLNLKGFLFPLLLFLLLVFSTALGEKSREESAGERAEHQRRPHLKNNLVVCTLAIMSAYAIYRGSSSNELETQHTVDEIRHDCEVNTSCLVMSEVLRLSYVTHDSETLAPRTGQEHSSSDSVEETVYLLREAPATLHSTDGLAVRGPSVFVCVCVSMCECE